MEVTGAYSKYLEVFMSDMSTEELAGLLDMSVEDIKLMELQLLNAWVYEETGSYFEDLPIGPKWLQGMVCDRTEALSKRMLKIWNKILTKKLKVKKEPEF